MEAFPDLTTLSDAELKELIKSLLEEEREISYRRRILHGRIDMLRAELVARRQRQVSEGESLISDADLARLTEILAVKAAPRLSDEELS